jgi:hypothetical protein
MGTPLRDLVRKRLPTFHGDCSSGRTVGRRFELFCASEAETAEGRGVGARHRGDGIRHRSRNHPGEPRHAGGRQGRRLLRRRVRLDGRRRRPAPAESSVGVLRAAVLRCRRQAPTASRTTERAARTTLSTLIANDASRSPIPRRARTRHPIGAPRGSVHPAEAPNRPVAACRVGHPPDACATIRVTRLSSSACVNCADVHHRIRLANRSIQTIDIAFSRKSGKSIEHPKWRCTHVAALTSLFCVDEWITPVDYVRDASVDL